MWATPQVHSLARGKKETKVQSLKRKQLIGEGAP